MLPLAAVAFVAFVAGAVTGAPGSPGREAADRFAEAWARKDFAAMYAELNEASRRATSAGDFADAYREAAETATLRGLEPDEAQEAETVDGAARVRVPVAVATAAFGSLEADLSLAYEDGIAWGPHLVFPGLRSDEHLENAVKLAQRAPILARDGSALAEGPAQAREHPLGSAAIDVTGEIGLAEPDQLELLARQGFPPETPVGTSGLERAFNRRLAGRPGGSLLAVSGSSGGARILTRAEPRPGAPLKTTVDPDVQLAAVAALAGRVGGIAALDARSGDVRALAGLAFSAPQPPGSTFKMVTTVAALQRGVVSLDDYFPIVNGVNVGGRFINNANGEYCGGSFREAFAHSCNADFAPLGPKVGNDALVAAAERFGFNSPPTLYAAEIVREMDTAESTIPTEIGADIDLGVSAIGQGEVLATPLAMAGVAQAIANGGVRQPNSIVANRKLRPQAGPVRVMSRKIAAQLTELMVGVVAGGTGYAGAIAEAQVAGKTGTAELGPKPGQEDSDNPVQIKDAWFAAFAPAERPQLAVSVLLIEAEAAGGEVAAPAAAEVLSAAL